jgi:hypothetical protein
LENCEHSCFLSILCLGGRRIFSIAQSNGIPFMKFKIVRTLLCFQALTQAAFAEKAVENSSASSKSIILADLTPYDVDSCKCLGMGILFVLHRVDCLKLIH